MKPQTLTNLYECFSDPSAAVFGALDTLYDTPWKGVISPEVLDMEYLCNHSGYKLPSPMVYRYIMSGDGTLTEGQIESLARVIWGMNGKSWEKLWSLELATYDPIENYNMLEEMEDTSSHRKGTTSTETRSLVRGKTGTESRDVDTDSTRTDNLTHRRTGTESYDAEKTLTEDIEREHSKTGEDVRETSTTDSKSENAVKSYGKSDTTTTNMTHGKTGTETTVKDDDITVTTQNSTTTTPNTTDRTEHSVLGFNDLVSPALADVTSTTRTGTTTEGTTGTETTEGDTDTIITYNVQDIDSGTSSLVSSGSDTDSMTGSSSAAGSETMTYGSVDTDTDSRSVTEAQEDTRTYDLTETDTGTVRDVIATEDVMTYNTQDTDSGTVLTQHGGTDTDDRSYTLTRRGNIGVMTTQNMITQEREVDAWRYFYDRVFIDVDRVLATQVY